MHKRREVIGGYKNLHNVEHHNLYSLPDICMVTVKKGNTRRAGMGEMRNLYEILVRKPEGKEAT